MCFFRGPFWLARVQVILLLSKTLYLRPGIKFPTRVQGGMAKGDKSRKRGTRGTRGIPVTVVLCYRIEVVLVRSQRRRLPGLVL